MTKSNEIFLLDTCSFTTPARCYYAFDIVPAYWDELAKHINVGRIVVLDIVKSEIDAGNDNLSQWIATKCNLTVIPKATSGSIAIYQSVLQYVNSCGLYKPSALNHWSQNSVADPWLIAAAKVNGYTLVTEETHSGGLSTKNKNKAAKIPDVAQQFDVETVNLFEMMRRLQICIK